MLPAVSALIVKNGWEVPELFLESGRLDEVFRSLTLGGVDAGGIPAMAEPAAAA